MASFQVKGGLKLKGDIIPQGAKNEALQILCAVLLWQLNTWLARVTSELGASDPETVRYYERQGLLPAPERTLSGYRQYDASDVERAKAEGKLAVAFDLEGGVPRSERPEMVQLFDDHRVRPLRHPSAGLRRSTISPPARNCRPACRSSWTTTSTRTKRRTSSSCRPTPRRASAGRRCR